MREISLSELKTGQEGVIQKLKVPNVAIRQRFAVLGLIKGQKVKLINKAPLGSPICIEVLHSLIAIRTEDAKNILIQVEDN